VKEIDAGIDQVRKRFGGLRFTKPVFLGSQALTRRQGRKVMVVITDGGDTVSQVNYKEALRGGAGVGSDYCIASSSCPSKRARNETRRASTALIQIFSRHRRKVLLRHIAAATGRQRSRKISDRTEDQYLLAYYPSQRLIPIREFRQLRVEPGDAPREVLYSRTIAPGTTRAKDRSDRCERVGCRCPTLKGHLIPTNLQHR